MPRSKNHFSVPLSALCAGFTLLFVSKAEAAPSCNVTPTNLVFGDVTSAVLAGSTSDITATISYNCTGATNNSMIRVCIELDYFNASNTRSMASGPAILNYQIYKDAAFSQVWGNSSDGNVLQIDLQTDGSGNVSSSSTMYGRVLAGQTTAQVKNYTHNLNGSSDNRLTVAQSLANPCTAIGSGSKNISLTATATVSALCNISAATLDFGSTPSAIASNIDSTATITALCTNPTPYTVGLDNGANANGSQRRMRLGATSYYVSYNLYTNAARTTSWLATTSATTCTSGTSTCGVGTGSGTNQNFTVYGRVPPQTALAAGTFSDTILVTVTY